MGETEWLEKEIETLEESYKHKLDPRILTQLITARGESAPSY